MVELKEDKRDVKKEGDKFTFSFSQVQEYEAETVAQMTKSWKEKRTQIEEWLNNFEMHLKKAHEAVDAQLNAQKTKFEQEVKNLTEGLELWKEGIKEDKMEEETKPEEAPEEAPAEPEAMPEEAPVEAESEEATAEECQKDELASVEEDKEEEAQSETAE